MVSIDSKAFNRMSYQECLLAFKRKGVTHLILRILAAFLTDRIMTVRVGNVWSEARSVDGSCPQGSILGVLLFNVTTEDLEDDCEDVETGDKVSGMAEPAAESFPIPGSRERIRDPDCSLVGMESEETAENPRHIGRGQAVTLC